MASAKPQFTGNILTCSRGGRVLFQNTSFRLKSGEVLHLTGANGAGKSSFLRIIAGVLPFEGTLVWQEQSFLENDEFVVADKLSFLPPDDKYLKLHETVFENLQFWAGVYGLKPAVILPALKKMKISSLQDTPVRQLSAGQRRRLSLARVFMKPAPLWLLDEPLNALDDDGRALFLEVLHDHCQKGGIAIIASHLPLDVENLHILKIGAA
jgi:heme exporter protein A